jgi:DNA polymerase-1
VLRGLRHKTLFIEGSPIQSTAAEILHVACILAERRGIHIVAPIHDALMAEADLDCADEASDALSRVMRDASSLVLHGYELPTDKQVIHPGERFHDDKGVEMWSTVERLLTKLEHNPFGLNRS